MPRNKFSNFPISSFDELREQFPIFLEYMRNNHLNTYGIGTDDKGELDFDTNLADPASFTGTTSNTFTLDTDDTGGDVSIIYGTTNNEFLKWVDTDSRFLLSDDFLVNGTILSSVLTSGRVIYAGTDGLLTDDADMTFNDTLKTMTLANILNADGGITSDDLTDTAWGIQNQNLVDKTATESISNIWTWTSGGIKLNNNIPATLGTNNDILIDYDSGNAALDIDLTTVADTDLLVNINDGGSNTTIAQIDSSVSTIILQKGGLGFPLNTTAGNDLLTMSMGRSDVNSVIRALSVLAVREGTTAITQTTAGFNSFVYLDGNYRDTSTAGNIAGRYGVRFNSNAGNTYDVAKGISASGASFRSNNTGGTVGKSFDLYAEGSNDRDNNTINDSYNLYGVAHQSAGGTTDMAAGAWFEKQTVGTTNCGLGLAGDGATSDYGAALLMGATQDSKDYYENTSGRVFEETTDNKFRYRVSANTDVTMDFEGTTNSGQYKWMEGEDYFSFIDDILMNSTERIYFNDTSSSIYDDGNDLIQTSDGDILLQPSTGNVAIGFTSAFAKLDVTLSHTETDVTTMDSNVNFTMRNSGVGNGVYNALSFDGNQQDMYIAAFNNATQASRRIGFFVGTVAGDAVTDERLKIWGSGIVETTAGRILNVTEDADATTAIASTDHHISIQYTDTGTNTATLPAISATNHGQVFHVKDADYNASINNITVATTGADTVEEAASGLITADGESWSVIANNTTKNWEIQ